MSTPFTLPDSTACLARTLANRLDTTMSEVIFAGLRELARSKMIPVTLAPWGVAPVTLDGRAMVTLGQPLLEDGTFPTAYLTPAQARTVADALYRLMDGSENATVAARLASVPDVEADRRGSGLRLFIDGEKATLNHILAQDLAEALEEAADEAESGEGGALETLDLGELSFDD